MNNDGRYSQLFAADDGQRQGTLAMARACAALTKPWAFPPEGQTEDSKLPESYQSLGSMGVTSLEGGLLSSLFQPGWFALAAAPKIRFADPVEISDDEKFAFEQNLFLRELQIQATLESSQVMKRGRRRTSGFRTGKRQTLSQILITGDALEQMTSDYRIRTFRRDQYVTRRDSAGDVLYHCIREQIDPAILEPEQLEKAGLKPGDIQKMPVSERVAKLYTYTEWQPWTKTWVVHQELNGKEIVKPLTEEVSQFFSTAFELPPGANYGRSWVELNYGNLRSYNELCLRILDFAALASDLAWCVDASSRVTDKQLRGKSGRTIRGARVQGGVVQDLAPLRADKLGDFRVVSETLERLKQDLGRAMLLKSESGPQGEAGRSRAGWDQTSEEIDGALGGFFAAVESEQQVSTLERIVYQLVRDKRMAPFEEGTVEYSVSTGLAAIERAKTSRKMISIAEIASKLGPEAISVIDTRVMMELLARYESLYEPGLIKTKAQRDKERQEQIDAQGMMEMNKQAAKSVGGIVETAATTAMQQGTQQQ